MLKFVMHMDFDSVGFLESADPALKSYRLFLDSPRMYWVSRAVLESLGYLYKKRKVRTQQADQQLQRKPNSGALPSNQPLYQL